MTGMKAETNFCQDCKRSRFKGSISLCVSGIADDFPGGKFMSEQYLGNPLKKKQILNKNLQKNRL